MPTPTKSAVVGYLILVALGFAFVLSQRSDFQRMLSTLVHNIYPKSRLKRGALGVAITAIFVFFNHPRKGEIIVLLLIIIALSLYGFSELFKPEFSTGQKQFHALFVVLWCTAIVMAGWHFWPEPPPKSVNADNAFTPVPQPKPDPTPPLPAPRPPRPSFTYVAPGVVAVNLDAWDFLVRHKGPKTNESVEILFTDEVRAKQVAEEYKKSGAILSTEDIASYERILNYPAVNPHCRGRIFADQFIWRSPTPDHERFAIEVTSEEMTVHEDLGIERVGDKWYISAVITDAETKEVLLRCKDHGFPGAKSTDEACFPAITDCE